VVLDFAKLNSNTSGKQTDPRKLFTTLKRAPRFKRPLDEQADVLDSWYPRRTSRNITLKMNTGAGKTVVGLLCLQSCLNEGVKPAVYVTPDKFLTEQVVREAGDLGIAMTQDPEDADFRAGRAILVINIFKLINGRSVFGVGRKKIPLGVVVVDDAHACLTTASEQFSIRITDESIRDELLSLFKDDLKAQSASGLLDIKAGDPQVVMAVPYWAWQSKQDDVLAILHANRQGPELEWHWPLLDDVIPLCVCAVGGACIEIAPRFLPIDKIPSFTSAERRIYMTATLADDTILVSHFLADAAEVSNPIVPKGGGDLGDRMILAPQEINPNYTTDEIAELIVSIAEDCNVVVIVPSAARAAGYWSKRADQVLNKDTIEEGVAKLRKGHVGLTVLVNKYDGLDLPGEACELLVIDGLPEVHGLIERVEMAAIDGTKPQLLRQIQRIEQGMGRGVRSNDDHCVVLLLGARLSQRMHEAEANALFSPGTRAQVELGRKVAEQIRAKPLSELEEVIDLCLDQDDEWVQASRDAVANAPANSGARVDKTTVLLREAFDAARMKRYDIAAVKAQAAVDSSAGDATQGYLKQQLAEYRNFLDPAAAQEIQISAVALNKRLLKPLIGASYSKLNAPASGQAAAAARFMRKRFLGGNDLVIFTNGLLEDLRWGEENSTRFEAAMRELGSFLGFGSQRPEQDIGKGPDNLWALGELRYLVIECKSGATSAKISKKDTNQLNGSIVWFESTYDDTCKCTPIMVHMRTTFEGAASPDAAIRIMDETGLDRLKNAIRAFATALAANSKYGDPEEVERQMKQHKLDARAIVGLATVKPGKK